MTDHVRSDNQSPEQEQGGVINNLFTVALAGLGAVLLVGDSVSRFANRLIGNEDETTARVEPGTSTSSSNGFVARQFESVFHVFNLPTHSEINRLSEQVDDLNRKVDQLNRSGR